MTPLYVVDAFTKEPFKGNPAAVCLLERWPADKWLQNLGREMNLSETACLVRRCESEFDLRWFTPRIEVDLCGHATLASAHALWENGHAPAGRPITFHTRSGPLSAAPAASGEIELDFPAVPAAACDPPPGLLESLEVRKPLWVGRNKFDYLVETSEGGLVGLQPDFPRLAKVECRGVIVTAKSGSNVFDFVSRFFVPAAGIDEDPVTGSAHCCLAEYWGPKLGKTEMVGLQASERMGVVRVVRRGDRVTLAGRATTVSAGHLRVPVG